MGVYRYSAIKPCAENDHSRFYVCYIGPIADLLMPVAALDPKYISEVIK